MRVFNAAGNPITDELYVGSGSLPSITATASGYAIAYTYTTISNAFPQNPGDIFVAFYDNNGAAIGATVQANTTATGVQSEAAITTLASGALAVVWRDLSTGTTANPEDIRMQLLSSDGSKLGPEIVVNQTITGSQDAPAIEALTDGTFVVVWQDAGVNGGGTNYILRGQHFAVDGSRLGAEFSLAPPSTAGIQTDVDLAALPGGRFVAVWDTDDVAPGTSNADIRAQIFEADGTRVGGPIFVANTQNLEFQPEVAANTQASSWSPGPRCQAASSASRRAPTMPTARRSAPR